MDKYEKALTKKQLEEEKKVLQELKKTYEKAKKEVQQNIANLDARTDMQNLQSIVYQKKYQEAILTQIDEIINQLGSNTYNTVEEYIKDSYINGYAGNMWLLQMQTGCTVCVPIDQKKIKRAMTNDIQLSSKYYKADPLKGRLVKEDVEALKKSVQSELSAGIVAGKTWKEVAYQVAQGMNSPFKKAMNNAMRIARTEGHRVNQQGFLDACYEAKDKGADIVKQWDSTLDGFTRPWHREADGQIRELDEKFIVDGEEMDAPSIGGSARNVCNCRCQLLQRARWALDEKELQTLKDKASYFGLDKNDQFEEFKNKYLNLPKNTDNIKVSDIKEYVDPRTGAIEKLKITKELTSEEKALKDEYWSTMDYFGQLAKKGTSDLEEVKKVAEKLNDIKKKIDDLGTGFEHVTGSPLRHILETKNVAFNKVKAFEGSRTVQDIIDMVAGADKTKGSCSSLAFTYIGNLCGYDVLDFRDGDSRSTFASTYNISLLNNVVGGKEFKGYNGYTIAHDMYKELVVGKDYYFTSGSHASVIHKLEDGTIEYLELQSNYNNGFYKLNDYVLKNRFGTTKSRTSYGQKLEQREFLIDADLFKNNDEFQELLGFINTAEDKQAKGKGGGMK